MSDHKWEKTPAGIDRYWWVADDGAIVGHAGSCNMGGGAPYYASFGAKELGQFVSLGQAKDAVEGADPVERIGTLPDAAAHASRKS